MKTLVFLNNNMQSIYYSPRGYWRGNAAISKLANAAKVKKATAANWLSKQAIWQIYLPRPSQVNFSHFDVNVPNEVHQADLLFLPHDGGYKYALTVVDVASRYKQAEPLKTNHLLKLLLHLKGFIVEVHYAGQIYYKLIPARNFMVLLHLQ